MSYERFMLIGSLKNKFWEAKSIHGRWSIIREYYDTFKNNIMANRSNGGGWTPYHLPFHEFFTPIESNVFNDIRCFGLPFVPQWPVGKYFIDFADPYFKVAIECDGKQHKERVELDKIRDKFLMDQGWTIYRIEGKHTFRTLYHVYRELHLPEEVFEFELDELKDACENGYFNLSFQDFDKVKELYFSTSSEGMLIEINRKYYHKHFMYGEETY